VSIYKKHGFDEHNEREFDTLSSEELQSRCDKEAGRSEGESGDQQRYAHVHQQSKTNLERTCVAR
jgi:hypothetical protein